jgi:choline kinase
VIEEASISAVHQAVVLCAGQGRRLRPFTRDLPKTLLDLGGGQTVLDHVLGALAESGVTRVRLVVGHGSEEVRRRRTDLQSTYGVEIELIDNPDHAVLNNAYSLWLGLGEISGDCVVANGDTLVTAAAVRRLIDAPAADLALAIDSAKALADEEMKVTFDPSGWLTGISKGLDPEQAHGEYVGIARLAHTAIAPFVASLEQAWRRDGSLYYEDGIGDFARAHHRVSGVEVGDLPWIEIDTPEDLERAKMMKWHS